MTATQTWRIDNPALRGVMEGVPLQSDPTSWMVHMVSGVAGQGSAPGTVADVRTFERRNASNAKRRSAIMQVKDVMVAAIMALQGISQPTGVPRQ